MKFQAEWHGEGQLVTIEGESSYEITGAFDVLNQWVTKQEKARRDAVEKELREKIEAERKAEEE
jgi:hypothetical protein